MKMKSASLTVHRLLILIAVTLGSLSACRNQHEVKPAPPQIKTQTKSLPTQTDLGSGMAWANGAVFYQIFPERFRNADTTNDPSPDKKSLTARAHAWRSNWYALSADEKKRTPKFYDAVFSRRYGGDLQGVLEKLDYLKSLGVTAIYFNPIHEAVSEHKYDATLMHHVDVNFGPSPAEDLKQIAAEDVMNPKTWTWTAADKLFLTLIQEAHKRGIRVVIDGVFNHTGTAFPAFQDIVKNQARSRFKEWFMITSFRDSLKQTAFDYKGWWGHKSLPEFKRDSIHGLADAPKDYIFAVTSRWSAPDGDITRGVDGWRLDAADDLPHQFWKDWRTHVKSINPNSVLYGEIWRNAKDWMAGDEFDAVMNYQFAVFTHQFFLQHTLNATEFAAKLTELLASYPAASAPRLMNLYDTHDTERLLSRIMNPNRNFDQDASPRSNKNYALRQPTAAELETLQMMLVFQFAYLGSPIIYYGDESGMLGADDPDCRKPMLWREMTFENESTALVSNPNTYPVTFNKKIFETYERLAHLKRENAALRNGAFRFVLTDNETGVIGFERTTGRDTVQVYVNASESAQRITVQKGTTDLLTGKIISGSLALSPRSAAILKMNVSKP
jgi:cyclomaltodextrinase / maltogenic alpha-amylase / neopullulanase